MWPRHRQPSTRDTDLEQGSDSHSTGVQLPDIPSTTTNPSRALPVITCPSESDAIPLREFISQYRDEFATEKLSDRVTHSPELARDFEESKLHTDPEITLWGKFREYCSTVDPRQLESLAVSLEEGSMGQKIMYRLARVCKGYQSDLDISKSDQDNDPDPAVRRAVQAAKLQSEVHVRERTLYEVDTRKRDPSELHTTAIVRTIAKASEDINKNIQQLSSKLSELLSQCPIPMSRV